jgi:hypothetical protein
MDALTLGTGETAFRFRLERYLDKRRKGRPSLDIEPPQELDARKATNATALSQRDPSALAAYSGYSTAFSYSRKARFVAGVAENTKYNLGVA